MKTPDRTKASHSPLTMSSVAAVLTMFPTSKQFDARCKRASLVGADVCRLRDARGDPDVLGSSSFEEYVRSLARAAGLSGHAIKRLLQWFGAKDDSLLDNATRVARLALALGLSLRELMIRVGIAAAESSGEPAFALARGMRRPALARIEDYEQVLRGVHWDAQTEKALRSFEREAASVYGTATR